MQVSKFSFSAKLTYKNHSSQSRVAIVLWRTTFWHWQIRDGSNFYAWFSWEFFEFFERNIIFLTLMFLLLGKTNANFVWCAWRDTGLIPAELWMVFDQSLSLNLRQNFRFLRNIWKYWYYWFFHQISEPPNIRLFLFLVHQLLHL